MTDDGDALPALARRGPRAAGPPLDARAHRSLLHHPVVSLSLILVTASTAQVAVWLLKTRFAVPPPESTSTVMLHGLVYDRLLGGHAWSEAVVFICCLLIALTSAVTWYVATRLVLGPGWALATGLCWVAHPSFAFVAQRPGPLTWLLALTPAVWCTLLWWRQRGRLPAAALLGASLAATTLVSVVGPGLLLVVVLAMLLTARVPRARRWACAGLVLVVSALPAGVWLFRAGSTTARAELVRRARYDLWNALDNGDGSQIAAAALEARSDASGAHEPSALRFLGRQLIQSPQTTLAWFAHRVWRTLYATSDGRLQRPLLVLHLLWFVPALYGCVVALRYAPWRWLAVVSAMFVAVYWLLAAVAEPLARNLTPVGGIGIVFALIGAVDVYERLFGRRLTSAGVTTGPASVRLARRGANDADDL